MIGPAIADRPHLALPHGIGTVAKFMCSGRNVVGSYGAHDDPVLVNGRSAGGMLDVLRPRLRLQLRHRRVASRHRNRPQAHFEFDA
jgi:hypothetical protein